MRPCSCGYDANPSGVGYCLACFSRLDPELELHSPASLPRRHLALAAVTCIGIAGVIALLWYII